MLHLSGLNILLICVMYLHNTSLKTLSVAIIKTTWLDIVYRHNQYFCESNQNQKCFCRKYVQVFNLNSLKLELNPAAQRCLPRLFTVDYNFLKISLRDVFISRSALKG
jgi:hypothetical protein